MEPSGDDFDRLGVAVARVLRDAFHAAETMRRDGIADAGELAAQIGGDLERALQGALSVQSEVRREAEAVTSSLQASVASAQRAVGEILAAARREADEMVAQAREILDRVEGLATAERAAFDHDLSRVVADLQTAVDSLKSDNAARRRMAVERAGAEAAAILRQARLHHRATAAEVDRMIEAAAAEAASLRKAAREDALRITEQVGGVVELGPSRRPRGERRAG